MLNGTLERPGAVEAAPTTASLGVLAAQALAEAMETMAFIAAAPAGADADPPAAAVLLTMAFTGRVSGEVRLVAPEAFGRALVANLLMPEPGQPPFPCDAAAAADALKELLNVTCGALFSKVPAAAFDISIPRLSAFDAPTQWTQFVAGSDCTVLDAEGFTVAIRVVGSGPVSGR